MRLIDAEARLKEVETAKRMWFGSGEAKAHYIEKLECVEYWIANAPEIDAVPVVRCKDCKNRFTTHCPMHHEEQTYNESDGYDWIDRDHTSDHGFCDQGEPETDDDL